MNIAEILAAKRERVVKILDSKKVSTGAEQGKDFSDDELDQNIAFIDELCAKDR